jgi:hypothetical protein
MVEQKGSGLFFNTYYHLFLVVTHCRKRDLTPFVLAEPLGARLKGSIGVVAVGLPHRNYSVFKQADPNKW